MERINLKDMNPDGYREFFIKYLYPIEDIYYMDIKLRALAQKMYLVVQVSIDKGSFIDFKELLYIEGDDKELIEIFESMDVNESRKEIFRRLWKR